MTTNSNIFFHIGNCCGLKISKKPLHGILTLISTFVLAVAINGSAIAQTSVLIAGDGSYSSNPLLYGLGYRVDVYGNNITPLPVVDDAELGDYSTGCVGGCTALDVRGLLPVSTLENNDDGVPHIPVVAAPVVASPTATVANRGREAYNPFFEIDWSIGLSASRAVGTEAQKNTLRLTPEFSLTNIGLRSQFSLAADAAFYISADAASSIRDGQFAGVEQVGLVYGGEYALDSVTLLTSAINANFSQGDVNAPGVAANIVQLPWQIGLNSQLGLGRQFGRFGVLGTAQLQRQVQTPTLLSGNIEQDNSDRNFVGLGTSLRTSYELTPNFIGFVEVDLTRRWYDRANVLGGLKLDGWNFGARGGVEVNWRDVLVSEFSVGYQLRSFDAASLTQLGATVFGADINYSPNSAVSAGAQFTTTLTEADATNSRPASIDYGANINLGWQLSPTFSLRALASGAWVLPVSGTETQTTYTAGAGADLAINRNVALNVDYIYTWSQRLPAQAEYQHLATVGLKISR